MSDAALRALERLFREIGAADDERDWLRARARAGESLSWATYSRLHELDAEAADSYLWWRAARGDLTKECLELAEHCSSRGADFADWIGGFSGWGKEAMARAALALANAVYSVCWPGTLTAEVVYEATVRLRVWEQVVTTQIRQAVRAHAREQANKGVEARSLARELRRLRLQRDRLLRDRERLHRDRRLYAGRRGEENVEPEPLDFESLEDAEPSHLRSPQDRLDPWVTSPLTAELARIRSFDLHALGEQVVDYLSSRAAELFPLPLYDPFVRQELEHLLPPVQPGLVAWHAVLSAGPPRMRLEPVLPRRRGGHAFRHAPEHARC